jgi:DMSO reductase anchor subunit
MIEPPHTQTNYLLSEMGFQIGRRHAVKLRLLALGLGPGCAGVATLAALLASGWLAVALTVLAGAGGLTSIIVERWLFFAEATHSAMLYYGRR